MTESKVARFPGARGRIPNFIGAEAAAKQIAPLSVWLSARSIKSNLDSPQRYVRYAALVAGKVVYMAAPRLRAQKPFVKLDPSLLKIENLWRASSIRGAFTLGKPISLEEMQLIDLVVTGSVAVAPDGSRVGKGGGYSDLEYALCKEADLVTDDTPIIITVHPLQIVSGDQVRMTTHDVPLNWIITPERIIKTSCHYLRPTGILWDELGEKLNEIPMLKDLDPR